MAQAPLTRIGRGNLGEAVVLKDTRIDRRQEARAIQGEAAVNKYEYENVKKELDALKEVSYEGWSRDQEEIDVLQKSYIDAYGKALAEGDGVLSFVQQRELAKQRTDLANITNESLEDKKKDEFVYAQFNKHPELYQHGKTKENYLREISKPRGQRDWSKIFEKAEPEVKKAKKDMVSAIYIKEGVSYTDPTGKTVKSSGQDMNWAEVYPTIVSRNRSLIEDDAIEAGFENAAAWEQADSEGLKEHLRRTYLNGYTTASVRASKATPLDKDAGKPGSKNSWVSSSDYGNKKVVIRIENGKPVEQDSKIWSYSVKKKSGTNVGGVDYNYTDDTYNNTTGEWEPRPTGKNAEKKTKLDDATIEYRDYKKDGKDKNRLYLTDYQTSLPLNSLTAIDHYTSLGMTRDEFEDDLNEEFKTHTDYPKPKAGYQWEWSHKNNYNKPTEVKIGVSTAAPKKGEVGYQATTTETSR